MMLTVALSVVSSWVAASPPAFPSGVSPVGLQELTRNGEVFLLPQHNASPFSAWILTRSTTSCASLEEAMLDVESYPKRWPGIQEVRVLRRQATRVDYEFDMDFILSPTIKGRVDHPQSGSIIFHDLETGGRASWSMRQVGDGCQAAYQLFQPKGKQSGFVGLITAVERGASDSGELAGAIASARGYMQPEGSGRGHTGLSGAGQAAWDRLAASGTAVRLVRKTGSSAIVIAKRRTDRPISEVVWSLRDRLRYPQKVDIVRKVKDHGRDADWGFGYFGGRVNLTTRFEESGAAATPEGLRLTERVIDGDLERGHWTWTLREVEGGTEAEVQIDLDISEGSMVLRSLAAQDPMIRDAGSLQFALAMMGGLIGGKTLAPKPPPPVAVK